jgi:hypothetical protein
MKRKSKIRLPALGALAAKLGSIALVVASDPAVLAHAAGKLGVSAAVLTSIVQAVTKPLMRDEQER